MVLKIFLIWLYYVTVNQALCDSKLSLISQLSFETVNFSIALLVPKKVRNGHYMRLFSLLIKGGVSSEVEPGL